MFTGIIEAKGSIESITGSDGDFNLRVVSDEIDFGELGVGDSIAVNGVCLTATRVEQNGFNADVSNETMQCTTLGDCKADDEVNLELSLRADSRLGGHIVSGHVDGVAVVTEKRQDGENLLFRICVPDELALYIARKGSVCVDGVSLTVNDVEASEFSVNIIPHTAASTIIGNYETGSRVNLEVDLIARYLERMFKNYGSDTEEAGLTLEKLRATGFVK